MLVPSQENIRNRFTALSPHLNEKHRRLWCASEAKEMGHGEISAVSSATGMSPKTIRSGMKDLLSTSDEQVEQNRAAYVLPHHAKLERKATHQS
ncbi:MAG: hypothetical protein ACI9JZ_002892 [Lentimonas sp.]|jgi:hypothetical protein